MYPTEWPSRHFALFGKYLIILYLMFLFVFVCRRNIPLDQVVCGGMAIDFLRRVDEPKKTKLMLASLLVRLFMHF